MKYKKENYEFMKKNFEWHFVSGFFRSIFCGSYWILLKENKVEKLGFTEFEKVETWVSSKFMMTFRILFLPSNNLPGIFAFGWIFYPFFVQFEFAFFITFRLSLLGWNRLCKIGLALKGLTVSMIFHFPFSKSNQSKKLKIFLFSQHLIYWVWNDVPKNKF